MILGAIGGVNMRVRPPDRRAHGCKQTQSFFSVGENRSAFQPRATAEMQSLLVDAHRQPLVVSCQLSTIIGRNSLIILWPAGYNLR